MNITISAQNQSFKSRFEHTKATKEVNEYAKSLGHSDFIKDINNTIKHRRSYIFHTKHNYSKSQKLSKTEIYYEKEGYPYKYIEMDSKISNPVELTFRIINDIKDKNSKVFKKIFE